MAYAYTNTIPGLVGTLRQLRSVFPPQLTPDTLKKWSIAPNNETYVLNVLRFLGIIDEDGKKVPDVARVFVEHEDDAFAAKFAGLVKLAYAGLFESFGEAAWSLERAKLIGFFRVEDESSSTVGDRQAATFQALAGLAGHGVPVAPPGAQTAPRRRESASPRSRPASSKESRASLRASAKSASTESDHTREEHGQLDAATAGMSLTVRIEINLPIADDQIVYDRIFKSIRANLINE